MGGSQWIEPRQNANYKSQVHATITWTAHSNLILEGKERQDTQCGVTWSTQCDVTQSTDKQRKLYFFKKKEVIPDVISEEI
jgi:predicted secreted protein